MNREKILAGLDAGHIHTQAIIMRGEEILGKDMVPTGFDVASAGQAALDGALKNAGIAPGELDGIMATGIFKDRVKVSPLEVSGAVPEYMADAKGALFLDNHSRTVIDIGGNIHKAIIYDQNGDLLDVIQNDKCADGLGIFYTTMSKALELSEQELNESALNSTRDLSIAIQCALSAQSDAIDLLSQGNDIPDVANAVSKFIAERVADMSTYMSLTKEIVVAGGLAKSQAIVRHVSRLLKEDISVLKHPDYVGAIGAVISYEGGRR